MAAQPANTDIKVFLTLRAQRQPLWFDSIAALIKRLRPLVMSIPAHEIQVYALHRDPTTTDFSPYMGEARHDGGPNGPRGFPIVIGLRKRVSFAEAQTMLPNVDFAYQIGQDKFIHNTTAGLTGDLQQNGRNLQEEFTSTPGV